ncbi:wall-associated receptor kinase 5-like, partial [Impatiens glandulifera]|uniref:wall-associated receptor kinase 5-like n=1 Tax=Impatiens glandulifera TaxID=253017 RepID=UPI001FB0B6BB
TYSDIFEFHIGTAIGITSLFMVLIWVHHLVKKRNLMKLREIFFQQNGGFMLRNQLSSSQGSSSRETAKIFTAHELEEATNRYNEANILGEGGFGTVYKGVLPNKIVVAVKVSKNMQKDHIEQFMSGEKKGQVEEFINEVIILSQVNHRHIVRLLGCCLETEVPLLVYEYISNGTLHDHIHSKSNKASSHLMSWENRLRIASETANAISYLHSSASIPIIHRDIKSTNILLDENYIAKVSDFGASRLVSIDTMELSTMVQGTLGYLDPEYLQTSQLTDKSDVYSFGVILAELLTGRNVLRFDCEDLKDKNLATYFLSALRDNRLVEILDNNILNEESFERVNEVANITKMCLGVRGEDRPSMKEVAMELEGLRLTRKHPWIKGADTEETLCLIDTLETSNSYAFGDTSIIDMGYNNTQEQILYPTSLGRSSQKTTPKMSKTMHWAKSMSTFFFLVTILSPAPAVSVMQPGPNCTTTCGGINIPFPFGTTPDCYLNPTFLVVCNETHFNPPKPFLSNVTTNPFELLDIMPDGQIRVSSPVARNCYNQTGGLIANETRQVSVSEVLLPQNFFISDTKNKFIGIGCDTVVVAASSRLTSYYSGCTSFCSTPQAVTNGSCSGFGCCLFSIRKQTRNYAIAINSIEDHVTVWGFNPCSHAFLGETSAFNFSLSDIRGLLDKKSFPAILDWGIGNKTCEEERRNSSSFACMAANSDCIDSTNGPGYFCNCSSGYQGNPYLVNGCQDVNECLASNPCDSNATCANSVGSFSCSCLKGLEGDGLKNGTGCSPKIESNDSTTLIIVLSVTVGLLVLLVAGSWIYWIQRKRKIIKLKEKFFQQNGGLLLQQKLSQDESSSSNQTTRIFTIEDLKKATNNYSEERVIGQGGFGTVYKGVLTDDRVVAIKKSKISDESQTEQFVNEVIILSQINHRNVVKLIGCCLETEVPSLVYEFITNGTLSERIHDDDSAFPLLTWDMRSKIAADTAEALAYLHSAASIPIIHRDIKSANILLDDMYTAKVSDFGASKLVPADQAELATLVQGTFGYLDPEYFFSNLLTEKSDVYSFGVVLVELVTGEKALSYDRPEKHKNLAMHFVCAMKEDRLIEILDNKIANNETVEEMKEVAKIAQRCLRMTGDERPTMREVATMLEGLKITEKHLWEESNSYAEEAKLLLDIDYNEVLGDENGYSKSADFNNLKNRMMDRIDDGR